MSRPTFSKGLGGPDIDAMRHAEVVARLAGYPLLWFTTVTPLRQIPDVERPALFNEVNNREWKFLSERGKGYSHCALRAREYPRYDEKLAGLHQHSCHWSPDELSPESLIRAMLGGSGYEWQGHKLVGQNKTINVAIKANKGPLGIIERVAYMGKERGAQFQWGLKEKGRLEKSFREGGKFWSWEQTREVLNPRWSATKGLRDLIAADAAEQERRPRVYLSARLTPPKAEAEPTPIREPVYLFAADGQGMLLGGLSGMRAPERPHASRRHRDKIPPPTLPMAYPPSIDEILEGLHFTMTDAEIAEQLRMSRPQVTNIRNRQFGAGRRVRRRVLELARAA
jgi:hypothetical protein